MKIAAILTAVAVIVILLFPPVDRVIPAAAGIQAGDSTSAAIPEVRESAGFVFISGVGGMTQIRYAQWLAEMGYALLAGGIILVVTCERPRVVPEL